MHRAFALPLVLAATATMAPADPPKVVTDIAPVHALVSQVLQGVGDVALLLPPGASPHGYAMRPSEAQALQDADMVVWVGEELTPWLGTALENLATDADRLALLDLADTRKLPGRDLAIFAAADGEHDEDHDHDHEAHGDEEHGEHGDEGHEEHADHAHDEHAHDEHAHDADAHDEHAHEHEHDHGGADPHAWLDPDNAAVWLTAIAEALAAKDPENAATYRENAESARAQLSEVVAGIEADLTPVQDAHFLVYHDAYQYFEAHFGVRATGAISSSDASKPSAARIRELRDAVEAQDISCVFAEPQYSTSLVTALQDGTDLRSATLDPLGMALTPGPGMYAELLKELAHNMVDCLDAEHTH